jgi:hypothetical protein
LAATIFSRWSRKNSSPVRTAPTNARGEMVAPVIWSNSPPSFLTRQSALARPLPRN